MRRVKVRFLEEREGREWRLPGYSYVNDLVLCGYSEEDLRVMLEWFLKIYRRRGLKVNADKSKVMVLGGEEGLKCEIHGNEKRL